MISSSGPALHQPPSSKLSAPLGNLHLTRAEVNAGDSESGEGGDSVPRKKIPNPERLSLLMNQSIPSSTLCDPIGKLSADNVRLDGEKVQPIPRRQISPQLMTVDARIVHKWVPKIKVEEFKVKFSSF